MSTMPDFSTYFEALWARDPFPWQELLARRLVDGDWPRAIDLPTASGKTACIDIAVYALAAQADRPLEERRAPRRIWFVVDRRVVVDEAFERARALADTLRRANDGPVGVVAERLRSLSGTERPLAVGRLRGGVLHDDGWVRIPSQPAVITSTVDQIGSQLLFRSYSHGLLSAPIFAGLAANDSLIVLDEAHCSFPFMQTLEAIARYRGPAWAAEPIVTPFAYTVMSATPPQLREGDVFPGAARADAVDHPTLERRITTAKLAELVKVRSRRGPKDKGEDPLIAAAVGRTVELLRRGCRRVAVMVNRVRTATAAAEALEAACADAFAADRPDVVLMTGRIRPVERDALIDRWASFLRASGPEDPPRPVVVVATQCLEVGADFSFDALVTECASLDALRQRFGRLARLGSDEPALASILVRDSDLEGKALDPIYGAALGETWRWLEDHAIEDAVGRPVVDLGIGAADAALAGVEDLGALMAPRPDAPVLLPAHLDLLCQTAPRPHPEPDVSLFLHGRTGIPEVSVLWRCDLGDDPTRWVESVALCPPVSGEILRVPLWRVRDWLARGRAERDGIDVEGGDSPPEEETRSELGRSIRPCLLWRGRDRSSIARSAGALAPGDVIVVPATYGIEALGQATRERALGSDGIDVWEVARAASGQGPAVRINEEALAPWRHDPRIADLLASAAADEPDREAITASINALLADRRDDDEPSVPPRWWISLLQAARWGQLIEHPAGGIVLVARTGQTRAAEPDLFADDDDLASVADREVSLEAHSGLVRRTAERIGERCLPAGLREPVAEAAFWHDAGKLDPRFQLMLRRGDEVALALADGPLAKSAGVPSSPARRRAIRDASGLPEGFRHEMLSHELVRRFGQLGRVGEHSDLVAHLVASHHGHGRPFAPVVIDPDPPAVSGTLGDVELVLGATDRSGGPTAHRIDSGLLESFWRLNRRYGWWGLAFLEAMVRLADWYASSFLAPGGSQ
ncbi:MAG TPA: type I-U CRISPR-associated helicase/endonuclease Cas3 [Acidimicrobiales bacterium]|jgi:CRISPR-associated endonuclease/helicase Cas3|nr:type I-U CRISPR-associated helicase/endonuclease Cas3 [Acidimicrobiales bacterium]